MKDVPEFIRKAREIYGYKHFINDAGGSVCELEDDQVHEIIAKHSLIIYIQASKEDEAVLIKRAQTAPKPLYYREEFLDQQLALYIEEKQLEYVAMIDPDDFVCWMFPKLFYSRIPRYEKIAEEYGYTISTNELSGISTEQDFLGLIEKALSR